jgi:hypothetical protein
MPELMVSRTLSLGAQEFGYSTSSLLLWKMQNEQSWVNASKQGGHLGKEVWITLVCLV